MSMGKFITAVFCVCVLVHVATAQTTTEQILQLQKFPDGLVLTGNQSPTEAENTALLQVLNQMDSPTWTTNLEKFLTAHPQSPWTASLRHDYAKLCQSSGKTTKALEQWEAAWPLVKNDDSPAGHALAGTILANWMEQLASLGRYQKLQELSAAGDAMSFSNPADRDKFQGAKSSWLMMSAHPGMAFRCGTFALKAVGSILRPGDRDLQQLVGIPSPTNGFSLAQLVELAKKYQLDMTAVKRTAGQELIVPSVVHWRLDHYAAILERQDGMYLVNDPTFGRERWLSAGVINDEAGGEFLVPSASLTNGWTELARNETEAIHGMGLPNTCNDAKDKGGCPCKCKGMPVAWVSEPYINLWMADEPVSYLTSSGEPFTFRLTYKQRDTRPNSGLTRPTGWNNSWSSYVQLAGSSPCLNGASSCAAGLGNSYATVYLPDGGTVTFAPNQSYDPETRLTIRNQGVTMNGGPDTGLNGLRLLHPDGSQDIYGFGIVPAAYNFYPNSSFLRSRHIDPDGNTTWYFYKYSPNFQVLLLSAVIDPDGRTNTLVYNSANLLAEVDNPYGLKAFFKYDANGNLTNIVDAQGLPSSITYDTNSYPTALITPYGTNKFAVYVNAVVANGGSQGNLGGHDLVDRAVQLTDPTGATSLWLYRYDCSTATVNMPASIAANEVPTGTPLGTLDDGASSATNTFAAVNFRNSFFWGPRQYAALSTTNFLTFTPNDYMRGRMRHWMQDGDNLNLSDSMSLERDSSPDGSSDGLKTFYDYPGKSLPHRASTNTLPAVIAWRLPGGESHWQWSRLDQLGNLTNFVETCTLPNGSLGTRTNQYVYADNTYSYVFGNWNGSGIVNTVTYGSYTLRNLLTQIIAADGQTVWSAGSFDTVIWTNLFYGSIQTNANTLTSLRVHPSAITNGVNQTATATWSGGSPVTVYTVVSTNTPITAWTFTGYGRLAGFKSYAGLTTTNLFNADRFLTQTIDLEIGRTNSFGYTSNGLVNAFTNELGLNVAAAWDNLLRLSSVQFPDGTYVSNRFDKLDLGGRRDRMGNWTSYVHDGARHLTAVTNANNAVTRYNWCGCGALESILDALNNATALNYDSQGKLTGYTFADASSVTFQMDLAGRTTNLVDGAGRNFQLNLNHQGLATNVTDALSHSLRRISFDLRDRPAVITDANSVTFTNVFDPLNRVLSRVWTDGIGEGFGYNAQGLSAYTNRDGKVTRYGRDAARRLLAETNANLEVTQFGYNPASEIVNLIDGLNHQTTWQYNPYGWLTNKVDGLNRNAFRYAYNANGWLTNRWTPEKGNTGYGLDAVGNVTNIAYPQSAISYFYDALNRLTNMVDAVGSTAFSYTQIGRLQSENGPWASDTVSYSYVQGLRTAMTIATASSNLVTTYNYDSAWRMTNVNSIAGGFIYNFQSALLNSPSSINLPNGAYITNNFDALARLKTTALNDHWGHTLDGYTYGVDALGLRTNIFRNIGLTNSTVSVGYDNINQITSWTATEGAGIPRLNEQLGFGYDSADNLHTRNNGGLAQTFTTDAANQLNNISRSGTLTLNGATPVPATSVTVNGLAAQTYADFTFAKTNLTLANGQNFFTNIAVNNYGVKATNIFTANLPVSVTVFYDNNGNLTNDGVRSYGFDAENQMTNATQAGVRKTDFVYDGLNRRRIMRDYVWTNAAWFKTAETCVVFDGFVPVQERDANNNVLVTYTRGLDMSGTLNGAGGIGGLLARTDATGSLYYHADASGNITALMDAWEQVAGRYMYDPFGSLIRMTGSAAAANTVRFSSMPDYWFGGAGFYGRIWLYVPQRWANNDPLGEAGGINLTMGMHNNPVSYFDSWGLRDNDGDEDAGISDARLNMAAKGSGFAADYGNNKDRQNRSDEIMDQGVKDIKDGAKEAGKQVAIACATEGAGQALKAAEKMAEKVTAAMRAAQAAYKAKQAEKVAEEAAKAAKQMKKLSPGEINKLKEANHDIHELKGGENAAQRDLFKDKKGDIFVKPKDGSGPGDPTGININYP